MPNVLLFAGTGGATARGAYGPESGMRASAGASSRAKRDEAPNQETRMPFRDTEPSTEWHDRVADLVRTAQHACPTDVRARVFKERITR